MCVCVYEFCGEDSWTQFPEKLPKNQCHREVNETQFSKKQSLTPWSQLNSIPKKNVPPRIQDNPNSISLYPHCTTMNYYSHLLTIWRFPKMGVPPKSSILISFSLINHPILGNPHIDISTIPCSTQHLHFDFCWLPIAADLAAARFVRRLPLLRGEIM